MKSIIMRVTLISTLLLSIVISSAYSATERGVAIKAMNDLSHNSGKLGSYRALVIGINDYQDKKIPALKTAVNDAREFADLLQSRYGFRVTLLLERQATKQAIMRKLRDLAADTSPDESVLIYYAGHGDLDRVLNDGWWIPVDAKAGDPVTYVDNNYVQRVMRGMKARHVLLVSDSCYSGTLFGESRALPTIIDDRYYLNLYNEKSRWGMTSGNKTPVSDSGSEGHSIFAYQLIKVLAKNHKPYLTTQEIYSQIAPVIANNSEQQPLCSPVRNTGDQGGGFVFVATRTAPGIAPGASALSASAKQDSDALQREKDALERERQELARQREAFERQKAMTAERERLAAERQQIERERQALAREQEKKVVAMSSHPSVSGGREVRRDGRFIAYDNGTVLDTGTNLMWAAKDNGGSINWSNAKGYCENYRGGGYSDWRMPTLDELAALYDASRSYKDRCTTSGYNQVHLTDLINVSCSWVWSGETSGANAAYFGFNNGGRNWYLQSTDTGRRVLPVRFNK